MCDGPTACPLAPPPALVPGVAHARQHVRARASPIEIAQVARVALRAPASVLPRSAHPRPGRAAAVAPPRRQRPSKARPGQREGLVVTEVTLFLTHNHHPVGRTSGFGPRLPDTISCFSFLAVCRSSRILRKFETDPRPPLVLPDASIASSRGRIRDHTPLYCAHRTRHTTRRVHTPPLSRDVTASLFL